MIRINGGEMKGSWDRGYYLSFNIAGKSSRFLTEGTAGSGDFLITSGLRLLCYCAYVLICALCVYVRLCVVWTEKNTIPGNGKRYCKRELEREKGREALIWIEMMERED